MSVHVFGIRHHGPGSARSLLQALTELAPDILLIEGPPEGEPLLPLLAEAQNLTPPVAMLLYRPDNPAQTLFYPFAIFSPEWQALQYAYQQPIPVRLIDLPIGQQLALELSEDAATESTAVANDPLQWLAEAAGYTDGESWWNRMVEQRRHTQDLFPAILEAMRALRQAIPTDTRALYKYDGWREAAMRMQIRAAQKEGYQRIAVVCGAWHAPVLADMTPYSVKDDRALLKGLAKVKVEATWIPWTYRKLMSASGYGAGVVSARWYEYVWRYPDTAVAHWVTAAAGLLRTEGFLASSAQLIDTVRLAETLAAIRQYHTPGLPELMEAVQASLTDGQSAVLLLIQNRLIVGEQMGTVSANVPTFPLQRDLEAQQKRLRLPVTDLAKRYELDLRKPNDLARSHLWYRLTILAVPWAKLLVQGRQKGTFRETWQLQWQPEWHIQLIEAAVWGNTIEQAATAVAMDQVQNATELLPLVEHMNAILLADLPTAATAVVTRLAELAAITNDVVLLMDALPPLVHILRYGDVRQTDGVVVSQVVDQMIIRLCLGLPFACQLLNDEAAAQMHRRLLAVSAAIALLQEEELLARWLQTLTKMADIATLHALLAGACCEQLLVYGLYDHNELVRRMGLALSPVVEPATAVAWLEGFLAKGGTVLLHDDRLWQAVDGWLMQLSAENFPKLLPLLRRVFANFSAAERQDLGARARQGSQNRSPATGVVSTAPRAYLPQAITVVAQLLGLTPVADTAVTEVPHEQ